VLVVDDDRETRDLFELLLERDGYDVAVAESGQDALAKLDERRPDAILLDLLMPQMDGVAFAEALDHRGFRPDIPLIVVSAHPFTRRMAAQIRAEGYVEKPFELHSLLDQVARVTRDPGPALRSA
jgi:two-component system response regulator MprA